MKRQQLKCDLKKNVINRAHLLIQANGFTFLLALLHKSEWADEMLALNQTRISFSHFQIFRATIYI